MPYYSISRKLFKFPARRMREFPEETADAPLRLFLSPLVSSLQERFHQLQDHSFFSSYVDYEKFIEL